MLLVSSMGLQSRLQRLILMERELIYGLILQVLQERGESTSRHGRATFSVLLFQVTTWFGKHKKKKEKKKKLYSGSVLSWYYCYASVLSFLMLWLIEYPLYLYPTIITDRLKNLLQKNVVINFAHDHIKFFGPYAYFKYNILPSTL